MDVNRVRAEVDGLAWAVCDLLTVPEPNMPVIMRMVADRQRLITQLNDYQNTVIEGDV